MLRLRVFLPSGSFSKHASENEAQESNEAHVKEKCDFIPIDGVKHASRVVTLPIVRSECISSLLERIRVNYGIEWIRHYLDKE